MHDFSSTRSCKRNNNTLSAHHDCSYLPWARERIGIRPWPLGSFDDGCGGGGGWKNWSVPLKISYRSFGDLSLSSRLASSAKPAEPQKTTSFFLLWRPTMATALLRTYAHRPVAAGALFGGRSSAAASVVRAAAPSSSLASLSSAACTSTSATKTAANAVAARYMSTDGHKHRNIGISAHIDR